MTEPEKMTLEAAIERLCEADHDRDCVRNGLMRGRPTADGGYECFYQVRGGTRWFRSKPVDETPKCDCGLDQAAAALREFRERGLPLFEAATRYAECSTGQQTRPVPVEVSREYVAAYRRWKEGA